MKYENYFKNHYKPVTEYEYAYSRKYNEMNILPYLKRFNENSSIVEIWSWHWTFAKYLSEQWFKNYIWFEIDDDMTKSLNSIFTDYKFYSSDVFEYLKSNPNSIDVLFMSNVFEHFTAEDWEKLNKLIYDSLREWGILINIMPNAGSVFMSTYWRYNDITHEIIYTENSYNHTLLNSWFNLGDIAHENIYFCSPSKLKLIIWISLQKILLLFMKYLFLLTGFPYGKVSTFEILTIARK